MVEQKALAQDTFSFLQNRGKEKNKTPFRRFFQYEYAELKNKPKN